MHTCSICKLCVFISSFYMIMCLSICSSIGVVRHDISFLCMFLSGVIIKLT